MSDRYIPNGTPLTAHEREILTITMEECAEVIQAASKLIRFGKENRPEGGEPNTRVLGLEAGDLKHMIGRLVALDLVSSQDMLDGEIRKAERLQSFLQTDPPG